jgi:hypothetical protein
MRGGIYMSVMIIYEMWSEMFLCFRFIFYIFYSNSNSFLLHVYLLCLLTNSFQSKADYLQCPYVPLYHILFKIVYMLLKYQYDIAYFHLKITKSKYYNFF